MKKRQFTKHEALVHLLGGPLPALQELGHNCVSIGPSQKKYLKISLQNSYEAGTFDRLRLELFRDGAKVDQFEIDLTKKGYRPSPDHKPPISRGGYWWAHNNEFYGWDPADSTLFWQDLSRIVIFCGFGYELK